MAVGNQPCDQVDQEVDGATMARMLDLRDVFELISDGLDDGSFSEKEFAHQAFRQLGNGMPIIDVARGEAKGQELALIVDNQVQLEAEEPTD